MWELANRTLRDSPISKARRNAAELIFSRLAGILILKELEKEKN